MHHPQASPPPKPTNPGGGKFDALVTNNGKSRGLSTDFWLSADLYSSGLRIAKRLLVGSSEALHHTPSFEGWVLSSILGSNAFWKFTTVSLAVPDSCYLAECLASFAHSRYRAVDATGY